MALGPLHQAEKGELMHLTVNCTTRDKLELMRRCVDDSIERFWRDATSQSPEKRATFSAIFLLHPR
jgi:hypothetical protein